ncbi:hypothetical protein AVEN_161778-1 [Araneus ventricosus]|uniref:Uncharacterized protein n=1 Tax=Araneus ventricosus TaxID=182803 RepID=A0A4Y2USE5_ARAVE|nr:hypothetical protein AVEN_161778-1 [Araneus ventricosus]
MAPSKTGARGIYTPLPPSSRYATVSIAPPPEGFGRLFPPCPSVVTPLSNRRKDGLFSLVILTKQHEGYFGTDRVILSRGQMTKTTLKLASPFQASAPHQRKDI